MYGSGYVGLSLTNMGKHYGISDIILLGLTPPFPPQNRNSIATSKFSSSRYDNF